MWDTAKVELRGIFIALNTSIRGKRSQINSQSLYLNKLEKKKQNEPNATRRKKIIEINEIENRKIENYQ